MTNIEADHLDFFGSDEAYVAVFDDFVDRLEPGGALVVCVDDPGARRARRTHGGAGHPGAALRQRSEPATWLPRW